MIQLGKPSNEDEFICVQNIKANELHKMGFLPIYRDGNDIYFIKNKEILEVINEWILQKQ